MMDNKLTAEWMRFELAGFEEKCPLCGNSNCSNIKFSNGKNKFYICTQCFYTIYLQGLMVDYEIKRHLEEFDKIFEREE